MKRWVLVLATITALAGVAVAEDEFESHWRDGKAELDGYRLTISRYGQDRRGTAVMIFVTEPFSESKRVKEERPPHDPKDTIDVLKLNLVRDFQTGVYDYNTMVSVFVRTATMEPVKVSFSSMEWCGQVYSELIVDAKKIHGSYSSYFEDESGPVALERPAGGVMEDELFVALRGLRKDYLSPGESRTVPYLPGVLYSRLSHRPLEWTQATITRARETESVEVPAGSFVAIRYDVRVADGRAGQFYIEQAYPHRIVKWSLPPDVSGELAGSKRLPYWKLHAEGDEKYLEDLGLPKPVTR